MPTFLSVETHASPRPLLLLAGYSSLIHALFEKYKTTCNIVIISEKQQSHRSENEQIHIIHESSAYLVDKLVEKIDYAIVEFGEKERSYHKHIFSKLEKDVSKSVAVLPYSFVKNHGKTLEHIKEIKNLKIAVRGELFSDNLNTPLSKFIRKAFLEKRVILAGNETLPIFPISETDAIDGVNYLLFSSHVAGAAYALYYREPSTLIASVHILKRIEHDLSLELRESKTHHAFLQREIMEKEISSRLDTTLLSIDSHVSGFEKSVRSIYESLQKGNGLSATVQFRSPKLFKKTYAKKLRSLFTLFSVSLLFFCILNIFFLFLSIQKLQLAKTAAERKDFESLQKNLSSAYSFGQIVHPAVKLITPLFSLFDQEKRVEQKAKEFYKVLDFTHEMSSVLSEFSTSETTLSSQKIESLLATAIHLYLKAEELSNDNIQYLNKIVSHNNSQFLSTLSIFPEILGFYGEKKYLVLFQNNGELRPAGGFIGSVGELTMKQGNIGSFDIYDVYDIDGQLKAHVEPHYIVRRYLQPHLYIRDSNFSPSFETSASTSALLYNLATQKSFDGVIALDFEVIKDILKKVGPIKLYEYDKTIDEKNAFDFLESRIESNFFPGSSEKKSLLQTLFKQLTLKFEDTKNRAVLALKIPEWIQEKHILFFLNDPSFQKILTIHNFSSTLKDLRAYNTTQVLDTFGVNEANIGVNKVNMNVSRKLQYSVVFEGKKIISQAKIILSNTHSSEEYVSYIRFIAPQESRVTSIKIDGKTQQIAPAVTDFRAYEKKNFKPPVGLEVDSFQEEKTTLFGFITHVSPRNTQIIEVTYDNGTPTIPSFLEYSLRFIKQPGTLPYPLSVTVKYPDGYISEEGVEAEYGTDSIKFQAENSGDKEYTVTFHKK